MFDTGARNTYIVNEVVGSLPIYELPQPQPSALAGKMHIIRQECVILGSVEGCPVSVKARIIDNIGNDEAGCRIEVLFGALAMQEWGINVDTKNEKLDMTHYSREFVEFK
ncbi:MAG: hypothetical protein HY840_15120 [Bacteroidetes bacterium]|nr:hypothetical protein [Bacteroidota bacterium]